MCSSIWTVLSGLLTPTIACFVAYIAWQQHRTARDKLRLDLFDRRYAIYRGLMKLFSQVNAYRTVTDDALSAFWSDTGQKRFLFGKDVRDYMDEVHAKAVDLLQARDLIDPERNVPDAQRNKAIEESGELVIWFHEQMSGKAMAKFEPYLGFPHKS